MWHKVRGLDGVLFVYVCRGGGKVIGWYKDPCEISDWVQAYCAVVMQIVCNLVKQCLCEVTRRRCCLRKGEFL